MYKHEYKFLLIVSLFLMVSCASSSEAEDEASSGKPTIATAEAMQKAKELYSKRDDLNNVREALKVLDSARDMDNRNYDVEWQFARMSYYLGHAEEISDEEAEKVLKKGLTAGKIAKRMEPNKPDGHFWYGAVLGEQARRSPVTVGITSLDDIKAAMQKVIDIDPGYQGASAYDALGLLELKTAGLGGGSEERAVTYLEKALDLEKNNSFIRLHLGEAYLAVDKKAKAKEQLEYVLKMEPDKDYLPEHERAIKDAKKLLKEKF